MRFDSELLYTDTVRIIVKVNGWEGDKELGSSLAQGETVEIAEDKAINRLSKRLRLKLDLDENRLQELKPDDEIPKIDNISMDKIQDKQLTSETLIKNQVNLPKSTPNDWTEELYEYENEIKRISLEKKNEEQILSMILGYKNRAMITNYDDIILLIDILRRIPSDMNNIDIINSFQRENLIKKNNKILRELNWDIDMARGFLYNNFNLNSRAELDIKGLIEFNMMLEERAEN